MGVNFAPIPSENSTNVKNTRVPASITPVNHPGTEGRMGGIIINKSNKSLWIRMGDAQATPALLAADPAIEVLNGGNWDIPTTWDGTIGLIWATGVNPLGAAFIIENLP